MIRKICDSSLYSYFKYTILHYPINWDVLYLTKENSVKIFVDDKMIFFLPNFNLNITLAGL